MELACRTGRYVRYVKSSRHISHAEEGCKIVQRSQAFRSLLNQKLERSLHRISVSFNTSSKEILKRPPLEMCSGQRKRPQTVPWLGEAR